jgi:CheY-like chemotaxis protein
VRSFVKVVLAAALLALCANQAGASRIEWRKRTVHPPEMSPITVIEVSHAGQRYWLAMPRRWEMTADEEAGVIQLTSAHKEMMLTVRFSTGDPSGSFESAEGLRALAAPNLGDSKVLETFPFHSDGGEGHGAAFAYGSDMYCRVAVVRVAHGTASFAVQCSMSQVSNAERVLTGFVTALRNITDSEVFAREVDEIRLKQLQPLSPPPPNVIQGLKEPEPDPIPQPFVPPPPPTWFEKEQDHILLFLTLGLMAVLTQSVMTRHRREAEIRALSGGYLSDGTEVANFKMPDWFAPVPPPPSPAPEAAVPVLCESSSHEQTPLPDPVTEFFFEFAPEVLGSIRLTLKDLAGAQENESRRKILLDMLHDHVASMHDRADCWELRPVWQLSSALKLLIKRIADKPKDITPSAIRTIGSACDLLHDLCVPGIRPNLAMEPPPRILAVDDEILCLRALAFALQKANMSPDVAQDGKRAVELATQKPYDVIFLDINMPEMDGLAACANIRQTALNEDTPIVFVTVLSDFAMRARTIAIGGTDFMAKPFFVFEMGLKSMTLLMRKRLDMTKSKRPLLAPPPTAPQTLTREMPKHETGSFPKIEPSHGAEARPAAMLSEDQQAEKPAEIAA